MNTRSKRASSVALLLPFLLAPPAPDGTIALNDRQHTAHVYDGIAPASVAAGDGAAAGSATVAGVGASTNATAGAAGGTSSVTGVGATTAGAAGSSAGTAAVTGVGADTAATAGSAVGTATVSGVITDANNAIDPTPDVVILVRARATVILVRPREA